MKRAAAKADALKADPPPTHNPRKCACPRCDPTQSKLQRAREKAAAERAAREKAAAELAAAPPPALLAKSARPFRQPPTNETRRMQQLLREGKSAREAIDIIEAEKLTPKDPTPWTNND